MNKSEYDALIVGGSHAGLSAAMALGRLRRSVLIVDGAKPRNAVAEHAYNIAGAEGVDPERWRSQARDDLKRYKTVEFIEGKVVDIQKQTGLFKAQLGSGDQVRVRKVILAYGIKDKLPDIDGIKELWGSDVFHCPYCHGYEVKDRVIGIIDVGGFAEHIVPLMKNISQKLVLFTHEASKVSPEFAAKLARHRIPVFTSKIVSIKKKDVPSLTVSLDGGKAVEVGAILSAPILPLEMNSDLAERLGCSFGDMGFIEVQQMSKTAVEGVFAAGDIMSMQQSVVGAAASGQMAGSGAVFELSREDFEG